MEDILKTDKGGTRVIEVGGCTYPLGDIEAVDVQRVLCKFVLRINFAFLAGLVAYFGGASGLEIMGWASLAALVENIIPVFFARPSQPHEVTLKMRVTSRRTKKIVVASYPNRQDALALREKVSKALLIRGMEGTLLAKDIFASRGMW